MNKNKVIKIGSKVGWKGSWGSDYIRDAVVENIQKVDDGEKYGVNVDEAPFEDRENYVFDLDNGHWCYGYQIVSLS